MSDSVIRPISAAATRPLRAEVLRRGQPASDLVYPGDDAPHALHVGAFVDDALAGIATVYPEPMPIPPDDPDDADGLDRASAFRLRGMATRGTLQGQGLGRRVLTRCLDHVREAGADVLWCNARTNARGFYERLGFRTAGDEFEIEGIGPHFVMWTDVRER